MRVLGRRRAPRLLRAPTGGNWPAGLARQRAGHLKNGRARGGSGRGARGVCRQASARRPALFCRAHWGQPCARHKGPPSAAAAAAAALKNYYILLQNSASRPARALSDALANWGRQMSAILIISARAVATIVPGRLHLQRRSGRRSRDCGPISGRVRRRAAKPLAPASRSRVRWRDRFIIGPAGGRAEGAREAF